MNPLKPTCTNKSAKKNSNKKVEIYYIEKISIEAENRKNQFLEDLKYQLKLN